MGIQNYLRGGGGGGGGEGIIPADGDNQCFNSKSGKSVHTYVALTFWLVFVFFSLFHWVSLHIYKEYRRQWCQKWPKTKLS